MICKGERAQMKTILIVDDHQSTTDAIKKIVEEHKNRALVAYSAERAFELFNSSQVDLIITDVKLPGKSGLELLKQVHEIDPDVPVVIITAFGTIQNAVEAMKFGAFDYIAKPFTVEEIEIKINKVFIQQNLETDHFSEQKNVFKSGEKVHSPYSDIIGQSPKMQQVFSIVRKAAPANSPVLILGESGTGKELVARALHYLSPRANQPFIKVNCAALAVGVLESELFGHERGAFTGALKTKLGRFELAGSGTIFLDEIGEIFPTVQVKLLRVLQDREFERVGGTQTLSMQARVIAATNQNLESRMKGSDFREDLFYRLNVVAIDLPPLRERLEDIPALVRHFMRKVSEIGGQKIETISPKALKYLLAYTWPGNIRELENVIERASVLSADAIIDVDDLTPNILNEINVDHTPLDDDLNSEDNYTKRMDDYEKQLIFNALMEARGNISQAAKLLGLKRTTLRYKMEKHDLLRFKFE